MKNQMTTKLIATVFLIFTAIVGAGYSVNAQTPPTVRIVLPERFRVITNQYFDLRVEAEGINRSTARVLINVEGENGKESLNHVGQAEITNDNDNNPSSLDKAWTYRKASFSAPGVKTIFALVIDGRRVYGTATQVSVQNFNIVGQKSIVLFIGDAMGTAYRDASRIVAQSTANRFREG